MREINEEKILINGLRINYKIAGVGQPILVLHGWGGSSDSWIEVQEILSEGGYKVICPDFPGFGKSETPSNPWQLTDYVKWTADFVTSQNLDKFFILAHSFGGRVAIKFSVKHPEKLRALILCSAAGVKPKPSIKTKMIVQIANIGNIILPPKLKDKFRNLFYIFLRNKDYVKAKGIMRQIIRKVLDEDLLPYLSKIRTKTLIVWGEKDRQISLKYAYIFREEIKNSDFKIIPEVGHSPHLETPEELSKIIISFLKS